MRSGVYSPLVRCRLPLASVVILFVIASLRCGSSAALEAEPTHQTARTDLFVLAKIASTISCGETVTGSISSANPQDTYTFDGNGGEAVMLAIAATSGTLLARAELRDAQDNLIGSNGQGNGRTPSLPLPSTGLYKIIVRDSSQSQMGAGDYQLTLQFITGRCPTGSILCGQTLSGQLSQRTHLDAYTFGGTTGEAVVITSLSTSESGAVSAELYGPTGIFLGWNAPGNRSTDPLTLPSTATYTVLVYESGLAGTPNYELNLQFVTGRCPTAAIACGQTKIERLVNRTQHDVFLFTGNVNESVIVTSVMSDGKGSAVAEVFSPTGALVGTNSTGNHSVFVLLPSTGTYAIMVHDYGLTDGHFDPAGDYDLHLQYASGRCAVALPCGQIVSGSLESTVQRDVYQFNAAMGEAFVISAQGACVLALFDPSGASLNVVCNPSTGMIFAPSSGVYTMVVWNQGATGPYDLELQFVTGHCAITALACGQTRSGTLANPIQQDVYTFTGNANELVSIAAVMTSGPGFAYAEVFSPTGVLVFANFNGDLGGVLSLPLTGTYTIMVRDFLRTSTGTYDLNLAGSRCAAPLSCGQTLGGSFGNRAQRDVYRFSGAAGEVATVSVRGACGQVLGPAGDVLAGLPCDSRTAAILLPSSGIYSIVAKTSNAISGAYDLSLQFATGGCGSPILCEQPKNGRINSPSQIDAFSLSGFAEESVNISALGTSGSLCAHAELYSPSGQLLGSNSCNSSTGNITLPSDGTYTLLVSDFGFNDTGTYRISFSCTAPPVLSVLSVQPFAGGDTGSVSVTIKGNNFANGAAFKLVRSGQPDIVADSVLLREEGRTADVSFNLTGKARALWDIVVANPGGASATLARGFTIEEGRGGLVWADITGRDTIRVGVENSYTILCGNRGNIDTWGVVLFVAVPKLSTSRLLPALPADFGIDPNQVPEFIDAGTEYWYSRIIYKLSAGETLQFTLKLTFPAVSSRDLRVWITPPLYPNGWPVMAQGGVKNAPSARWVFSPASADPAEEFFQEFKEEYRDPLRIHLPELIREVENEAVRSYSVVFIIAGILVLPPISLELGPALVIAETGNFIIGQNGLLHLYETHQHVSSVTAVDPNIKLGNQGAGQAHWLTSDRELMYTVLFENLATASAPAQDVFITDQLDTTRLDVSTFSIGSMAFGENKISPSSNGQDFSADVDLRPSNNLIVRVSAHLDKEDGLVTWRFTSIDPATGQPPDDPLAGFLPPNVNPPGGEGRVSFSVRPKQGLATGTEIRNTALIVFDVNEPISTPEWLNTIDDARPTSQVQSPNQTQCTSLQVQWSGSDADSGILGYTVLVSDEGGPFTPWVSNSGATSAFFEGVAGHTYSFYSVAQDNVGNFELAPDAPDATVTLTGSLSLFPTSQPFPASGGTGNLSVTTLAGCQWTASADATWITVTAGEAGAGNGTVSYTVGANSGPARTGTMTIGGQTFTVNQESGCAFSLSAGSQIFDSNGGAGNVSLTCGLGCLWTAVSNDSWITITSNPNGSGNGTVDYSVVANTGSPRMGTMTIAGITFTVTQDSGCTFTLNRDHQSFPGNGGNGTVNVTASDAGCAWTASTTSPFITITSGSGTGNGAVEYTVAINAGTTIRSDTITIAGHTFTVYQGINFLDVPSNDPFYTDIGKLAARNVTVGCGSGNFCPNNPVTREQMAAFIMRALGEPNPPPPASQRFDDVPPENPFYNLIDRLAALNITVGCSTTPPLYCPSAQVTREQMAVFILRALGEFNPPPPASQRFDDVPPTSSFYNFIDRMAVLNITFGCSVSPPLYCPASAVTRAQMAAFLVRAFNL